MRIRLSVVPALLLGVGAVLVPVNASAAPAADTTPPTVNLEPYGRFVVGNGTFHNTYSPEEGDYWSAQFSLHWTASDPSGICKQTLAKQSYDTLGGGYDPVLGWDTVTHPISKDARSLHYGTDFWDNARVPTSYVIRVQDCSGNGKWATSRIATTVVDPVEDTSSSVHYTGTWKTSSFSGFSEGTTHSTTAPGASFTTSSDGGAVALVMEKAPNRGSADVYVDGQKRATISTYSATTMHQAAVWQSLLTDAPHTIKVVNRATAGHPRIDLDVVLR